MNDEAKHVVSEVRNEVLIGTILLDHISTPPEAGAVADALLAAVTESGAKTLVIDLQNVKGFTSSMIGELLRVDRTLKKAGGSVALVDPCPEIERLLAITRFDKLMPIYKADSADYLWLVGEPDSPAPGSNASAP